MGRFLSADTIVPEPGNPQAWNRYSYSLSSPLKYFDPSGHRTCTPKQAATGDETCSQNYPVEQKEHPVFVDPELFGFTPGRTVDLLPYLFYRDPRRFDFTASVEWYYLLPAAFAPFATHLVGQGSILDKVGVDENYPVIFEIYCANQCGPFDARTWQRDIVMNGRRSTLFLADWQPVYYKGGLAMRETFDLPGGILPATEAAYLKPIVGDPTKPIGHKDPLAWETVGFDPLSLDGVKVRFETRQTSPTTIETIGNLYFQDVLFGMIKLNGTYRGK